MCGIAGLVGWPRDQALDAIGAMTRSLAHRGPDAEDFWFGQGVAFGHRRLSIIDLSPGGAQPMTTDNGRYCLVYNGELFNFVELRRELARLGHRFSSRSDTEVVLHALIEWDSGAAAHFNGQFAFAFWDSFRHRLILGRDRYGIKPLYVWERDGSLAFASEAKGFLPLPGFRVDLDLNGVVEYLNFQNFFTNRTLFKGVEMFPAGHVAEVQLERDGRMGRPMAKCIAPYWDFRFREPATPGDEREYMEELDRRFRAAVQRQLVADVPVASYLSGGIDTGGITAVAASQMPLMRTFTVGFDMSSIGGLEQGHDERAQAERMSHLCGTEHYEMVLKAGDMERSLRPLVTALEEPRVGQSYPNYYAAQLASRFGKVVLSGAGGDEIFAGYPWRYFRPATSVDFSDYESQYFSYWQRMIPHEATDRPLLSTSLAGRAEADAVDPRAIFRSVFPVDAGEATSVADFINLSLYFEAKTFLHGLLVVEDKLSMAHGLEARVPMLDNDLVDFALELPLSLKLANLSQIQRFDENQPGVKTERFYSEHGDGKLILRRLLQRYVGDEQANLRKQGFSGPDASWFRGQSVDFVRRTLTPQASLFDVIERDTFLPLLEEHLDGKANRRLLVWSLLSLQTWLDVFG